MREKKNCQFRNYLTTIKLGMVHHWSGSETSAHVSWPVCLAGTVSSCVVVCEGHVRYIGSLVPRPPPFFVLRFAFSIIHWSGALPLSQTEEQKTGEAWERGYYIGKVLHSAAKILMALVEVEWSVFTLCQYSLQEMNVAEAWQWGYGLVHFVARYSSLPLWAGLDEAQVKWWYRSIWYSLAANFSSGVGACTRIVELFILLLHATIYTQFLVLTH